MPARGVQTRDALIRAGEHLFARHGVGGTRTKDIVERAGQGNDSAVQYHFGSRQGLLAEIVDRHLVAMQTRWQAALPGLSDTAGPQPVLACLIEPLADELGSPDGRDFLRITASLAGWAGVRTHALPARLRGTPLAEALDLLEQRCRGALPADDLARERIAMAISMLTAALADRAHRIDEGRPVLLEHTDFVANLIVMIDAALLVPPPD